MLRDLFVSEPWDLFFADFPRRTVPAISSGTSNTNGT